MSNTLIVRAAMALAALSTASAAAADVDFTGSMVGQGVVMPSAACAPIPNSGSINPGPGLSNFGAFSYSHSVCTQAGVGPIVGTFVVNFGVDEFYGTLLGSGAAGPSPTLFDLLIDYTITGGTGRFVGATGSFVGQGTADVSVHPSIVSLSFGAVPEPASWAMMLLGFGGVGLAVRRRRKTVAIAQLA